MKASHSIGLSVGAGIAVLSLGSALVGSGVSAQGLASITQTLEAKKVGNESEALAWIAGGDYFEKALQSGYPTGSKGQVYAGEYNMTGSKDGINVTVRMRAAYTSDNLYFQIEWQDPTGQNDLNRRRFLFNGPGEGSAGVVPGWSSQLNDDKFAMAFDINGAADSTGTFQEKGCTVGCHGTMNPTQGIMDIWHWKTSRSNPLGYINDQWADPTGRQNDAGDPIEVRNWKVKDDISQGPKFVWDPTKGPQVVQPANPAEDKVTLDPGIFLLKENTVELRGDAVAGEKLFASTCQGCHNSNSPDTKSAFARRGLQTDAQLHAWITDSAHPGSDVVSTFTQTDWDNVIARIRAFTGVPGYYLQKPTGSSADLVVLNSSTVFNSGNYTVQVRRKLQTGSPDDVQFDPAAKKEYVFGVAVMDKDGKNHAGSPREILRFLD
jgi:mono/diheme cytochrome c family protein